MSFVSVAIDGPTGAGKTTLARVLAGELGYIYVDTGAMYRAIGLCALRHNADPRSARAVVPLLDSIKLEIISDGGGQRVLLGDSDVSAEIRSEQASKYASDVSAIPAVRDFLLDYQRAFAGKSNVIMEGRDIGTVVLPNATAKIFLTGTSHVRAKRRYAELAAKGQMTTLDDVHKALLQRDYNDSHRQVAPLRPSADAVIVDTTHLGIDAVKAELIKIIKEKTGV